jgi:hypothetical protein
MYTFRKHRGSAALPITKGFSISPDRKPHRKTVSLSLYSFAPELFSAFRQNNLFGSALMNSLVPSPFAVFSVSYPLIMDGNLATHSSKFSLFTSLDSPQSSLKLSHFFCENSPTIFPSFCVKFLAYSCTIVPCTWWFFALTLTNHSHAISLTSSFVVFLSYLLIFHYHNFLTASKFPFSSLESHTLEFYWC